jgi:hypothetical protein
MSDDFSNIFSAVVMRFVGEARVSVPERPSLKADKKRKNYPSNKM